MFSLARFAFSVETEPPLLRVVCTALRKRAGLVLKAATSAGGAKVARLGFPRAARMLALYSNHSSARCGIPEALMSLSQSEKNEHGYLASSSDAAGDAQVSRFRA